MIDNTYTFQEVIGFGGSSKVFSAVDQNDNKYALKAIRKDKGYESELESMMVLREFLVMDHVGEHPNIIKHFGCNPEGVLELDGMTQSICYNVMEYCDHGSLSTIIKHTGAVEEDIARFMFVQLSHAVKFLHDKRFAHLDIKLENILLDKYFNIKLGDFGSGVSLVKTYGFTNKKVGTPLYMAPEVINLAQNKFFDGLKADIYSLGVTLCLMLLGELPNNLMLQYEKSTVGSTENTDIEEMTVDVNQEKLSTKLEYLSPASKDLLSRMTNEDPLNRPSIDEILAHEWITGIEYAGLQELVYSEMQARIDAITAPLAH